MRKHVRLCHTHHTENEVFNQKKICCFPNSWGTKATSPHIATSRICLPVGTNHITHILSWTIPPKTMGFWLIAYKVRPPSYKFTKPFTSIKIHSRLGFLVYKAIFSCIRAIAAIVTIPWVQVISCHILHKPKGSPFWEDTRNSSRFAMRRPACHGFWKHGGSPGPRNTHWHLMG